MSVLSRIAEGLGLKTASGGPNISWDGVFSVQPMFDSFFGWGARTNAGPVVSVDSSMGLATLYACVRVLAESVASLPLVIYRRLPDGGKQRADDHHFFKVFHDAPNPAMTSFVWRETIVSHLATWGNAYCEVAFDGMGQMQLWPMSPARISVGFEDGRKVYDFLSQDGNKVRFPDGKVFHIPGLSSNGLTGLSPISLHRGTLGLYQALEDFGSAFMRNGARPSVVMTHPKTLSKGAIERLATQMDDLRGSGNAGKTIVMEEGLSLAEIGVPPEDAQYIQSRKFQAQEVQRMYRMPPHMVQDMEHATFTNIEHQSLDFVVYTLMPWLVRIEQQISVDFLSDNTDYFIEFLVDGLLRGDAQGRAEALQIQRMNGVINADEWRAKENLNPIEDGSGKTFWMPANMMLGGSDADAQDAAELAATEQLEQPALTVIKSAKVRCVKCNRLLADQVSPPFRITCPRCKAVTADVAVPA